MQTSISSISLWLVQEALASATSALAAEGGATSCRRHLACPSRPATQAAAGTAPLGPSADGGTQGGWTLGGRGVDADALATSRRLTCVRRCACHQEGVPDVCVRQPLAPCLRRGLCFRPACSQAGPCVGGRLGRGRGTAPRTGLGAGPFPLPGRLRPSCRIVTFQWIHTIAQINHMLFHLAEEKKARSKVSKDFLES